MTRLRRRPRTVYRVYDEDEYLGGVDALTGWEDVRSVGPAARSAGRGARRAGASRERRLRRLAGAAALTGAVGTVGGVVGLADLRARSVDRRASTQHLALLPRTAAPHGNAGPVRVTRRRHVAHLDRARRGRAGESRSVTAGSSSAPASRIQTRSVPEPPARAAVAARVVVASAVRSAPAEAAARPRAQGEFGFER